MKKIWVYITALVMGAMTLSSIGCGTGQHREAENADSTHLDTNTTNTLVPDSMLPSDTMRAVGGDSLNK